MRTVPVFNQGRHIPIRTGKGAAAFSDKRPLCYVHSASVIVNGVDSNAAFCYIRKFFRFSFQTPGNRV